MSECNAIRTFCSRVAVGRVDFQGNIFSFYLTGLRTDVQHAVNRLTHTNVRRKSFENSIGNRKLYAYAEYFFLIGFQTAEISHAKSSRRTYCTDNGDTYNIIKYREYTRKK